MLSLTHFQNPFLHSLNFVSFAIRDFLNFWPNNLNYLNNLNLFITIHSDYPRQLKHILPKEYNAERVL